jgi:hypothetical protein
VRPRNPVRRNAATLRDRGDVALYQLGAAADLRAPLLGDAIFKPPPSGAFGISGAMVALV